MTTLKSVLAATQMQYGRVQRGRAFQGLAELSVLLTAQEVTFSSRVVVIL